jgi:hypothetical protein
MSVSPVNSCCAADLSVQETQDPSGSQVDEAARRQLGLLDSEGNVVASAATPSALPVLSETARGGGPSLPTPAGEGAQPRQPAVSGSKDPGGNRNARQLRYTYTWC